LAASQSSSPEEVSPRSVISATRASYHEYRTLSEIGTGPRVANLDLPTGLDRGWCAASFCVVTGLVWNHSRITSARRNSTSLQASRRFDSERSSTGETSWARACFRATAYCLSISEVRRAKKVRSFHSSA